jgi:hypothetical protein
MQKIFMILALLVFFYYSANAGLFGDDVDLADLSQLSPDALETLKDTEFKEYQKALNAETKAMLEANNLRTKYEKTSKQ